MVIPGYKRTEVGVIPEDWEVCPIGDVIFDLRGGAPLRPSDFTDTGVKVLPKGGVIPGGVLTIEEKDQQFCSDAYATKYFRNQVDSDYTIVVLRDLVPSGPSIGLMVKIEDGDRYLLAQGVYGFQTLVGACPEYLIQISNSAFYRRMMNQIMVGSTQVHITNGAFKSTAIPLPSLHEQRAIAEALSDVDNLIASLDSLIAKKRAIKKAVMQDLLTGRRRLPGFEGEWKVKRLGEIAEIVMGQSPSSAFYNTKGNGLPLIQGNADIRDRRTIVRNFTSQITKRCSKGATILSVRAPVGEVAIAEFDACIGRGVCAITYPSRFLYHYLVWLEPQWSKLSKGSTFDSVTSVEVQALEIRMPDTRVEEDAIGSLLDDIDAEIIALQARRDKTKVIKQGMMQELLTGRVRLV